MPTPPKGPVQQIKITQQSVNLVRQILAAVGWAKSVEDIYLGGQMLASAIPEIDLSWVKSGKDLAELTPEEQKAYVRKDRAWCEKVVEFTLTAKQVEVVKKAFKSLVESGNLAPNSALSEIIEVFGLYTDEA